MFLFTGKKSQMIDTYIKTRTIHYSSWYPWIIFILQFCDKK